VSAIPRQELEGRNMRALINPVWMENSVAFVVADERRAVSKRQVTRDGRDIIVTGMPVFDGDGNIKRIVINARDITEIYHLREELLNAKSRELQHYQSVLSTVNVDSEKMVAISESIKKVFLLAKRVGGFDTTVLILGESGAGKEEVARQIHRSSLRRDHALVTINCGAIPENLLESELFGYEKGAFTGASNAGKIGLLEAADGGTVFLDEVGELPLPFQVKLLRVLETKQVTRVGGIRAKPIDVRFIAATNRNLNKMVQDRTFREDLYYRLNVVSITVPPLRQRREDILPLSLYFLNMFNHRYNQNKVMTPEVIKRMEEYDWKGNVRELRNVVEHMVIMSPNTHLQISDVPWIIRQCGGRDAAEDPAAPAPESVTDLNLAVRQLEIRLLEQARKACGSTREMARYLHIDQSTVVRKLHKYGLTAT
jgi:transcriptional regulator with PAS, ATPase and Fis domain